MLGGAGQIGGHVVHPALTFPFITSLVIADYDAGRAHQCAAATGDPRVRAVSIDATDTAALVALFQEVDVVVSTIGPYYRFGATVLQAAIEAQCHYIDVCDDPEPTLEMLRLHDATAQAGITAVVGAGASPGIANMLAATAIGELDRVDSVLTIWGSTERDAESSDIQNASASLEHWLEQCSGRIPVFAHGALGYHAPLQEITFEFPGFGSITGVTVGHPEPITLPCSFPQIRHSYNVMNMPDALIAIMRSLVQEIDNGALTIKQAAAKLHQDLSQEDQSITGLLSREGLQYLWATAGEIVKRKRYLPVELAALAIGFQGGKPASVGAMLNGSIPGGMGPNTGIPAAVTLAMLAEGEIQRRGVFAIEGVVAPERFFERLAPFVERRNTQTPIVRITTATEGVVPSSLMTHSGVALGKRL
jgi:saccharopine dehydrogenase-like NADP-dependent oxidoreductase